MSTDDIKIVLYEHTCFAPVIKEVKIKVLFIYTSLNVLSAK